MKHHRQQGAALLTALLIVSLVASLAAAMVWRQYRAVQVEAAERARAQADWMLQGALDWARIILRADELANRNKRWDHLGEVWAVPLAEARLSSFLAQGQGVTDTTDAGPDAFLSGGITDAQALYNLYNLIPVAPATTVSKVEMDALERLCAIAGAPPDTARLIAERLPAAYATTADVETAPLRPVNLDQLAWFGLSQDTIERLRPLMVILPERTLLNLNTASREVIASTFDNVDLASAERLVQGRKSAPLDSPAAAAAYLQPAVIQDPNFVNRASVFSSYFFVTGRLRLDQRVLQQRSLVQRFSDLRVLTLQRQLIGTTPASPAG
ncbi:type II secretion system minor pseudopilin GspK [Pelomonas sp. KK5]|uniref:type II secretion system minor pseudopilin GspK n=1 Tax=Pelomonas sp. KK5 TaxID=1855730 RepID=UPI00097BAC5C|nr:type II secretion system minor pseudopilin GspK [Pelomonas sp. KK5]